MKCNSCGANVADTAKFCEYCGTKLTVPASEPVVEPAVEAAPVTTKPVVEKVQEIAENTDAPKADVSREQAYLNYEKRLHEIRQQQTDAAMAAVPVVATEADTSTAVEVPAPAAEEAAPAIDKEIFTQPQLPNAVVMAGKSGIFAAANILFTINTVLTALFSIGGLLLGAGGAVAAIAALSEFFDVDVSGLIEVLTGDTVGIALLIGIGITVLANVPNIILSIGLLSTRSACKRSNGENIRPTGLKLIRFVTVLGIIFISLICAAALCVSILFITGDPYTKAMGITTLTFTIIAIIAFAFCYAKIMDSLSKAIDTAEGYYEKKASTFLGVLCIIVAVFSLANIIGCLALIFHAVTLFKYNSIVKSRNAG